MAHSRQVDRDIDGKLGGSEIDGAIGRLAEGQHGVVGRGQLLSIGVSNDAIEHRLQLGRLRVLHRGVYAVGHRALRREARWMAAVLGAGRDAVLSHRSAAALWGLGREKDRVDVSVRNWRAARAGIHFHRASIPADEVTTRSAIPVTTVPRTLYDLATVLPHRQLERALNEAEVLRLWDELSLDRLLDRYPRRPGNRAVRAVLGARRAGAAVTKSELEVMFLAVLDGAELPPPAVNVLVEGFEVDAVWRDAQVAVELDGRDTHGTAMAFERDRERDRILQAAGWRVVRITFRQMRLGRDTLVADLHRLLDAGGGRLAA